MLGQYMRGVWRECMKLRAIAMGYMSGQDTKRQACDRSQPGSTSQHRVRLTAAASVIAEAKMFWILSRTVWRLDFA